MGKNNITKMRETSIENYKNTLIRLKHRLTYLFLVMEKRQQEHLLNQNKVEKEMPKKKRKNKWNIRKK